MKTPRRRIASPGSVSATGALSPSVLARGVGACPRIERLLVATDLSPSGDQAVPWAYALVASGGVVRLAHIVEPRDLPGPLEPQSDPTSANAAEAHRRRVSDARNKLKALVPADAAVHGVRTEVDVLENRDPAKGIGLAVRRFRPDVVCLASTVQTAGADPLMGSVVGDILRQTALPVLLVRSKEA